MASVFPWADYGIYYITFAVAVCVALVVDLGVFQRTAHTPSLKESLGWTLFWILVACGFGYWLHEHMLARLTGEAGLTQANQITLEFFTGYVLEKILAFDNIFVFVVIFQLLAIPPMYQHRVLFYGILGALFFRAVFIAIGSELMGYPVVVIALGVLLILTGLKVMFAPQKAESLEKNRVFRWLKQHLPVTDMHGALFWVRQKGVWRCTPLFLALVLIELFDVVFALDSVPAIFAITHEPFIVFTSNILAILGLRSLYFLILPCIERFHLLKYGIGVILVFVGLKMAWLNACYGGHFPIVWSLAIIATIMVCSMVLSWLWPQSRKST